MEVSSVNESGNNIHSLKFMNEEIISINEYGKAIHDYSGRAEDELTFEEEDVILLSLKDDNGDWFFGELNGSRGWFPSSYIRILTEKECINEGIAWPPQSSLLSSASCFSIKSSSKDPSVINMRNRCNSKDSFSSVNSMNHVTVPTNNEDSSNPTLPVPQVRSWYSKYQQIKRYQPKKGNNGSIKLGSSALSNPPIAASNISEKNQMIESERKIDLTSPSVPKSLDSVPGSSNFNSSEKQENSPLVDNEYNTNSNNNNNENIENKKDDKLNINNNSDDDTYNKKFINEVANILNSNSANTFISLDDKVFKEENDASIDSINISPSLGSINDLKRNNNIYINNNVISLVNLNNDSNNKAQALANSQVSRSNLSVNVNTDVKRSGHHSAKANQSAITPTRVIHRVTTPTATRQKWSDFVSSNTIQGLSKNEIQRQEVMFEMINTEKDYLKDLKIVMDIYIEPMKTQKVLRQKDIDVIFSDWENILLVHTEITKRLEDRQKQGYIINEIGDIWIQMSDYLKVYTMYCSNHPFALVKLQSLCRNKNFTKFLESRLQLPESRNLNLANFLLKPVQRICKYPLLLREIIKNTNEDHSDYKNLVSALYKIETVITIINDAAKQTEGVHKLLELQQRFTTKVNIVANLRTIVHKSEIDIIEKRLNLYDKKRRQMYLLNDMVLIARSSTTGPDSLNTGKLKLMAMISTKEILVKDLEDTQYIKNCFELVHTGKQSYRISVDTPMNKDVWLKMLNNVILNDVQSSKVDSVTSMKPSVETTYKSLNGKKNLKNLSPKTPDYRIATLKFGDASMIKEVEQEFNRINSQSYMSDTEDESSRDDDKSINSTDAEESIISSNVHYTIQEMPSICEGVVSDFDRSIDNKDVENNSNLSIKDKNKEEKEKEKIINELSDKKENIKTNEKKNEEDEEEYEEEEDDEEKSSPLQTITISTDDDIFKVSNKRGSHSLDFEGINDYYHNDLSSNPKDSRKRFSFPLSAIQSQNININNIIFKEGCESPAVSDVRDEKTNEMASQIVLSDEKIMNEKDSSINDTYDEQTKMEDNEKNQQEDNSNDVNDNNNEDSSMEGNNIIMPLKDILENTNSNSETDNDNEDEDENEEDIHSINKFANEIKSSDSLAHIKSYDDEDNDENQFSSNKSESALDIRKSSESIKLHSSSSNNSLVIKNERDEDSDSNSTDNDTMAMHKNSCYNEDFSFDKIRNMFGETSNNKTSVNDIPLCVNNSEENKAKKEELKNIILPAKIRHTPDDNRRGLIINTMIEDNKTTSVDSPTRLIYDISKNPFIIKDMSSHKPKNDNLKTMDKSKNQLTSSLTSSPTISGRKVHLIKQEFFSKDNDNKTINNNIDYKIKENKNEVAIKSPLIKEVQLNGTNNNSKRCGYVKTVKFDSSSQIDTTNNNSNLSVASCCVNSKKVNFGKTLLSPKSPLASGMPYNLQGLNNNSYNTTTSINNNNNNNNNNNSINNNKNITAKNISPLAPKDVSSNKPFKIGTNSSNINRPVNNAKIVDVKNICIDSTKKYVYAIEVDRGLSDISTVHHTYDDFFDLHLQLIGNFPEEAGVSLGFSNKNSNSVSRRIIPDLPAQMMFVSEATARNRISGLQEYINTILHLPGKISKHPLVMNFFKTDGKWSASVYSNKKP
ncbi:hypothetical protein BCR36DRAFT_127473 [Piromyces finnis]|uniref:DH domain-containing protein n=1 Tax=Piromyces finnis TaxID=1754191 RepID=A0A1Y1V022_9FUNG|nr:hypothetical protein BCR36DRAFT_127473 [Piromyces finnis]|eukprot:ORX44302.1 hypothetical protein BCR36DRAFT_127473 [Piromyces finnis]